MFYPNDVNTVVAYDGNVSFGYPGAAGNKITTLTNYYYPRISTSQSGFYSNLEYVNADMREPLGEVIYEKKK